MKTIAFESSGQTLSVAACENGKVISEYFFNAGMIHSETILGSAESMLKTIKWNMKDADRFAVSTGPGSFTGIRVAMAVVKTLSQSLNKQVVCVDCLSILENNINIPFVKTVAAIDALRGELFIKNKNDIVIVSVEKFIENNKKHKNKIIIAGNAAICHKDILSKKLGRACVSLNDKFHYPHASTLALMSENMKAVAYNEIEPLYVRKSWAEEK